MYVGVGMHGLGNNLLVFDPPLFPALPHLKCSYENIVQIRCLLEGVAPQEMLQTWHDMLPAYMQRWGLDRGEVCPGGCCSWSCACVGS